MSRDRRMAMSIRRAATVLAVAMVLLLGPIAMASEEYSQLDTLKNHDLKVILLFKDTNLSQVLHAIAASGAFKLTLGKSFSDTKVTIPRTETSLRDALSRLGNENHLAYSVPTAEELVVESAATAEGAVAPAGPADGAGAR
jgi:hypothetical protein